MASVATLPSHLSRWGLLGTCEGTRCWSVVALESVSTEVLVRGFVAQVSAKMVYLNGGAQPLQVQAVFPVDESAAVYHFEARLDERTIVTHCMEKKKAEKVYKEAVEAGKTAVLARENEDTCDIFTLMLGNLPAGSRAELNLRLVMELKVQTDGGISFVLPTVLNPRYCPPDHPLQEGALMTGSEEHIIAHVPQPYSIDVNAQVRGNHHIARIISHTDPLTVTLSDDAMSAQVQQDGGFKCDHDWSMLVYYNNPYKPHLLRETGDLAGTGIMKDDVIMLNFFPEVPANTYCNKNEIIFVIDRSGSMHGENIQSARATLLLFLKSLPAGCLFNVVSFGSTFSFLFKEGSRTYTEETLSIACNLQANMKANMGGTEILRPLQKIYSVPPQPGYSRQILLVTDGHVWNVDRVLQLVHRHAHETRLFSVGVGHGASTALVHGSARAGRGRSEMVVQQSLLQQKVMGLVSSMVQESVQDVSIACEVEPASRVTLVPKVPPVIFGGQHLILYARVPSSTQLKSITVRGQLGTKALMNIVEGRHITTVHDEAKSLHRLAARAQIQQWQVDDEEDIAEDMVTLSLASGVVCRRTALVGVDQESGKPVTELSPCEDEILYDDSDDDCSFAYAARSRSRSRDATSCDAPIMSATRAVEGSNMSDESRSDDFSDDEHSSSSSDATDRSRSPDATMTTTACENEQPLSGLLEVVGLQQFDGSWNLEAASQLTSVPRDVLCASNPAKEEAAWATALVLVLLERKFDDQRNQWALLATKAQTFIAGCGEQVEELLAKARLTLDAK